MKDKFMDSKQNNLAHMNLPYSKYWNGLGMFHFNTSPYSNIYLQIKGQKHRRWESITTGSQHSS